MRLTALVVGVLFVVVAGCTDDLGPMAPTPTRIAERPQVISTSPDVVVTSWDYLSPQSDKALASFPARDPDAIEFAPGNRQATIIWREGGFDLVWGGWFCSIQPILTIGEATIELWENNAIWDDCEAMETIHAFKVEIDTDMPPAAWRYATHEGAPADISDDSGRTVTAQKLLALVGYPPRDTPYLIGDADFWLVHHPGGNLLAFVPVSPDYRADVTVEACRFTWNDAVGRFVDPCSGDEWALDGTLNLAHSTERWSNRDLDQYALTVGEATVTVHLDQVITGAARADTPLDSSATAAPATPTRPAAPYGYSGITVTLQDVSSTQYEIDVSLRIEIAADPGAGEVTGASLAYPALVDEQGNQYEPRVGTANSQTTVDGLLVDVTQSHQPGALGAKTLTLKTGLELRAKASSALSLDLRGRHPGDRWPVDHTVEIYGLVVPIEEVALVTDPGAPPGSLSLQVMAPCVNEAGVELVYLEMLAEGAARQGDGQGGNPCGDGQERLVSTLTVESMLDGSAPGELEGVVLQLAGRLHLPGPWELSWEVDE